MAAVGKNYPKEVLVEEAILLHKSSIDEETETDFLAGVKPMFERLVIYESLFSPFLSGAILVQDVENTGINSVFSPGDVLKVGIRSGGSTEDDAGKIHSVKTIVYKVDTISPKENPSIKGYALYFASPSYTILNQIESDHVFDEFFGKISKTEMSENFESSFLNANDEEDGRGNGGGFGGGGSEITSISETESPTIDNTDECDGKMLDYEKEGFVNHIIKEKIAKADEVPYDIEGTKNTIWYRQFFPLTSARILDYKTESLYSILNECKYYAQSVDNKYAVNHFFWQDLDGIHFRSVEGLISAQEENTTDNQTLVDADKVFVFTPDVDHQPSYVKFNRVNEMKVTQFVDMLHLLSKGVFGSLYRYWVQPRLDLVDSSTFGENEINFEMSREEINYLIDKNTYVYYYPRDRSKWKSIEDEPLISSTTENEETLKPSLTNILKPQVVTSPRNYEHGYNVVDESPLTSFYNHYNHTSLDICTLKDVMFIQKSITETTEHFYNYLIRKRMWDYKDALKSTSCSSPLSFMYTSGEDDDPFGTSTGLDYYKMGGDPPYKEPSCSELANLAAAIPDECSMIEAILGPEYLGCATRDYWYYGSIQRATPTAKKKSHTHAELSFFKDICSKDDEFIELMELDSESASLNWSEMFPGLFSEGPTCTCPCQNSPVSSREKNFGKYLEYNSTFSRYWNTDPWVPLLRNAQYQLFKSQQVQLEMSGNLKRKPGEIIYLHIPVITAMSDAEVNLEQGEYMSGKYMITSIKHTITSNNNHTMSVELCRDGFNVPYSSINPETMGNNILVNTNNRWVGEYKVEDASEGSGGMFGEGMDPMGMPNDITGGDGGNSSSLFSRDLNIPGYLNPSKYDFFRSKDSTNNDEDLSLGELGGLAGVEDTSYPNSSAGDGGTAGNYENIDEEGKTVSQKFHDAINDDTKPSLGFISSALQEGVWQNFSRYQWNNYGEISGYYSGFDLNSEESGEAKEGLGDEFPPPPLWDDEPSTPPLID
jgi:hypothetical protein